jgi:hypothetical protein
VASKRSSRAAYVNGFNQFTIGRIARTNRPGRSLTIVGDFRITAEGSAVVGNVVNKVGRTTGWSQGSVTNTCVNTNVSGTNITQICQNFVSATVGSGDSGSPVFQITSGNDVRLVGISVGRQRLAELRLQPAQPDRAGAGVTDDVLSAMSG